MIRSYEQQGQQEQQEQRQRQRQRQHEQHHQHQQHNQHQQRPHLGRSQRRAGVVARLRDLGVDQVELPLQVLVAHAGLDAGDRRQLLELLADV